MLQMLKHLPSLVLTEFFCSSVSDQINLESGTPLAFELGLKMAES
jgi:hypothetical protein